MAATRAAESTPSVLSTSLAGEGSSTSAISRCSTETYSSDIARAVASARFNTAWREASIATPAWALWLGRRPSSLLTTDATREAGVPTRSSSDPASPPSWRSRASSRCSGPTAACPRSLAVAWAAARASWDLTVNLSRRIGSPHPCRRLWHTPAALRKEQNAYLGARPIHDNRLPEDGLLRPAAGVAAVAKRAVTPGPQGNVRRAPVVGETASARGRDSRSLTVTPRWGMIYIEEAICGVRSV